ncbi:MAG: glycosyltransferase family 4 protein [Gemmatimonadaceae bacterium]
MPLRILHVDSGRHWRGTERQAFLLAQGQREAGHEPLVVARPASPLLARARAAGLAAAAARLRGAWDLASARRLRRLVRWWRPDVVHAHDERAAALAHLALAGRREILLVVSRAVPPAPRLWRRYREARVSRVIVPSSDAAHEMVTGGIPEPRIAVVPPTALPAGTGPPRDWRTECRWPADALVCGVVGSLAAHGDARELAAIVRQLPPALRERVGLVLIGGRGTGSTTIGRAAAYRAGYIDDLPGALAGLDVLWYAAAPGSGSGTALVTAMATGIPTVAFRAGVAADLVEHERSGLLVAPGDARAFAAAATRVLEDPALRRAMSAAAVERAAALAPTARATAEVYLAALGREEPVGT